MLQLSMVRSAGGVNFTDPSSKMRRLRQKVRADRPSIHPVSAHGGFFGLGQPPIIPDKPIAHFASIRAGRSLSEKKRRPAATASYESNSGRINLMNSQSTRTNNARC